MAFQPSSSSGRGPGPLVRNLFKGGGSGHASKGPFGGLSSSFSSSASLSSSSSSLPAPWRLPMLGAHPPRVPPPPPLHSATARPCCHPPPVPSLRGKPRLHSASRLCVDPPGTRPRRHGHVAGIASSLWSQRPPPHAALAEAKWGLCCLGPTNPPPQPSGPTRSTYWALAHGPQPLWQAWLRNLYYPDVCLWKVIEPECCCALELCSWLWCLRECVSLCLSGAVSVNASAGVVDT